MLRDFGLASDIVLRVSSKHLVIFFSDSPSLPRAPNQIYSFSKKKSIIQKDEKRLSLDK